VLAVKLHEVLKLKSAWVQSAYNITMYTFWQWSSFYMSRSFRLSVWCTSLACDVRCCT